MQAHRQVEISLVNPRRARRFAESLGERSKTDPVDARVLCEYAVRMPRVRWQRPSKWLYTCGPSLGPLKTWVSSILKKTIVSHALRASQALPVLVVNEMQRHKSYLNSA